MGLKLNVLKKSDDLNLTDLRKIVITGAEKPDNYRQELHKTDQDTSDNLDFVLYGLKFKPDCNVGTRFLKSNLLKKNIKLPDSLQEDPNTLGIYLENCLVQDDRDHPSDIKKYFGTFTHSEKLIILLDLNERARKFELYNDRDESFLEAEIMGDKFDLSVRKMVVLVFSPEGDLKELNLSEVSWDKSKSPLRNQELHYQRDDSQLPDLSRSLEKDGYLFDSVTGVLLANRKLNYKEYPILHKKLNSARKSLNLKATYFPGDQVILNGIEYTCISEVSNPGSDLALSPFFVSRDLEAGTKEEFEYVELPYSPLNVRGGKYLFGEDIKCDVDLTKTFRPIINPSIDEVRSPFISDNLSEDNKYYQPISTSPGTTNETLSGKPSSVNWIWRWTGKNKGVLRVIKKTIAGLTIGNELTRITSLPSFDGNISGKFDPSVESDNISIDSDLSQLSIIFGGVDLLSENRGSISIKKSINLDDKKSESVVYGGEMIRNLASKWSKVGDIKLPEIPKVNEEVRSMISSRDYSDEYDPTPILPKPTEFKVVKNRVITIEIQLNDSPFAFNSVYDLPIPLSLTEAPSLSELEKISSTLGSDGRSIKFEVQLEDDKTGSSSKCVYIPLTELSDCYEVNVLDCHGGEVTKLGEKVKRGENFNMSFYPDEFKVFDKDNSELPPEGSYNILRDETTGIYNLTIINVQSDIKIKLSFKDENK